MSWKQISILTILAIIFSMNAFSQSKEDLERKKQRTQNEIKYINRLLSQTKKNSKASMNKLVMINRKINLQKQLILNISAEIKALNAKINTTSSEISKLETELKKIKIEYAKMIYFAYINRSSYQKLMFIMSSDDFNQAYKRLKYLQQYTKFRQNQAELIQKTKKELSEKIANYEKNKEQKKQLIGVQKQETDALTNQKIEQKTVLNKLKSKEGDLKKRLKDQVRQNERLKKRIAKIIEEERIKEAEKARKAAIKNGTKTTTTKGGFALTPAERLISDKFGGNKGHLPWPTESGFISSLFGKHKHPVLPELLIQNNGIDITTSEGTKARAIFGGVVSKIVTITPTNKAVLIRHGGFFTLYSNLKETYVKSGDNITSKQYIGLVNTTLDDRKTILHLEIWEGSIMLNPSLWLSK